MRIESIAFVSVKPLLTQPN